MKHSILYILTSSRTGNKPRWRGTDTTGTLIFTDDDDGIEWEECDDIISKNLQTFHSYNESQKNYWQTHLLLAMVLVIIL